VLTIRCHYFSSFSQSVILVVVLGKELNILAFFIIGIATPHRHRWFRKGMK